MCDRTVRRLSAALLIWSCFAQEVQAAPALTAADRSHADAMASFRQGRFPEAYGRFIELADSGHAPSAGIALFMFAHGTELFGRDWDVSQEQLTEWSRLVGRPAPVLRALVYPRT